MDRLHRTETILRYRADQKPQQRTCLDRERRIANTKQNREIGRAEVADQIK